MKKLMLLGGSRYLKPVIESAHKLGLYVITCDYLPNNYAHKLSDEYINISIIDKEAVLKAAQEMKIDGIMSFACDPGVVTAAYVAEKMGLPNVGPYESVCILQNKRKFRKFLAENGFVVPTAKGYNDIESALNDADVFRWPVIVKPVDAAGSKGVAKVEEPKKLRECIESALSFSHCNEFIIEEFVEKKGYSSDSDSFSVDGELRFVSFNCQYFDSTADNPYTPAAFSWPSCMSNECQKKLKKEIQRLIKLLEMKTAIYNIETREGVDGKLYIMELSPRGGGNRLAECLCYSTGLDLITEMIKYSVGMEFNDIKQQIYNGFWCEVILHSGGTGIFEKIWISEDIKDYLIEEDLWVKKGMLVSGFKAADKAIGTLIFRMTSQEEVEKVLSNQNQYIKVVIK